MEKRKRQIRSPEIKRHQDSMPGVSWTSGVTFVGSFSIYVMTLAPTVTFEDSGELIAAAHHLGVPHEPGYPLFTMLAHLFTYLPIGNVAYRVNLASAFFSALGAMFVSLSVLEILKTLQKQIDSAVNCVASVSAGLLFAASFENWEQSIIAEVYGMNTAFCGALLWLTALWTAAPTPEKRDSYFTMACAILGLALSNHHTVILLVPALAVYILWVDRRFLFRAGPFLKGVVWFALGLIPYAYLPIASSKNPLMDWGNPENLTNFLRVVSRHQYQLDEAQTLKKFLAQLGAYGQFVQDQWIPFASVLAVAGFAWFLYRRQPVAKLIMLWFVCTGPLTTFLTNFDVITSSPIVNAEHKALVSVFYIPSYMILAVAITLGLALVWDRLRPPRLSLIAAIVVFSLIPAGTIFRNITRVDMSEYYFTEDYVGNLLQVVPENGVVFINWDPFIFPMNYYQMVEKRRNDVVLIDQELLRRTWYIQSLRDHQPDFMRPVQREVDEFLQAVKPFEEGNRFDGNFIQSKYIAMINAMIDRPFEQGRAVFLTYDPLPEVARNYVKESVISAVRLRREVKDLTPVDEALLKFRGFDGSVPLDRMARFFKTYYGRLYYARGFAAQSVSQIDEAERLYSRALSFLDQEPGLRFSVQKALQSVKAIKADR